jgi:hypothetical protein
MSSTGKKIRVQSILSEEWLAEEMGASQGQWPRENRRPFT